ncbi:NAD(P)-binding domain superfamily protein [Abortiporus biennis]
MPSYLITGSSRGIGLGLVQELLKNPQNQVLATGRNLDSAKGLQELRKQYPDVKRLALIALDISKPETIIKAAEETDKILPNGLDVLISNAGISRNPSATWDQINNDEFLEELGLNTISILNVLRVFRPLVSKSTLKKVVIISSTHASIELSGQMPDFAFTYGTSKAALNMLIRRWGKVYKKEGITTALIHPGWVATDMGLSEIETIQKMIPGIRPISIEESTTGLVKLIGELKLDDSVSFFSYDGTTLPW